MSTEILGSPTPSEIAESKALGGLSNFENADIFDVFELTDDDRVLRRGSYSEFDDARRAAEYLIQATEEKPRIIRTMVFWVYKDENEESALEVATYWRPNAYILAEKNNC